MEGFFNLGYESKAGQRLSIKYKTNLKAFLSLLNIKKEHAFREKLESRLFLGIGMVVSLLMVITAFQWKFYDDQGLVDLGGPVENFEDLMDVPLTEQPPPPPPKQQVVTITEVADDEEIIEEIEVDLDLEVSEETLVEEVVHLDMGEIEEEEAEEIFTIVEDQPVFKGGLKAFYEFVSREIKYPNHARRMGVEGKVFLQFVVDKDGTLTDIQVVKGIGAGCDEEAMRVIEKCPKWKAGKQRGKPVKVRMIIPIHFVLD